MKLPWVAYLALVPLLAARGAEVAPVEPQIEAEARVRLEYRNNADLNGADDERWTVMHRIRAGVGAVLSPEADVSLLLQDSRTWDPLSRNLGTHTETEVLEAWLRYAPNPDWTVIVGRQPLAHGQQRLIAGRAPLAYGRERLVGAFEWGNVARRFDAVKVTRHFPAGNLDAFVAALGASPGTYTADGEFAGLYGTWPKFHGGSLETYALYLHDPSLSAGQVVTLGARRTKQYAHWFYDAELAGQFGDVLAFGGALEAGKKFGPLSATLGYYVASGDDQPGPGGGVENTFNQLFAHGHLHHGYMDYQGWRNLHNVSLQARLNTGGRLSAVARAEAFWLYDRRDSWYGAGGAARATTGGVTYRDPTGASGNEVGQEIDVVARWLPVRNVEVEGGWGHFWPGAFIRNIHRAGGLDVKGSDWFYCQVNGRY